MALINTYLHFDGNAEEAFNFYKSVFGGEFAVLQRYGDVSDQPGCGNISESDKEKIMHIALPIRKENILMGSDTPKAMGQQLLVGNNFSISVHTESREETEKILNGLSTGGQVTMPLADTFWGSYFGMCKDKFGTQWMVSFDKQ
ncbi:MAG: VOC family protein [Pyrinomonadaceae bacterium]